MGNAIAVLFFIFLLSSIVGLILSLIKIFFRKEAKKNFFITGILFLITIILFTIFMVFYSNNYKNTENNSKDNNIKNERIKNRKNASKRNSKPLSRSQLLSQITDLASNSRSTDEINVTEDLEIGNDKNIKPGIYDLEVLGGTGNIGGERKNISSLFINWAISSDGMDYPSKIRLLLLDGDSLHFDNISKIKFNAVPEKVSPSNSLGQGNFVVGRDINPGTYKISTNAKLNPEYGSLGWQIEIYDPTTGKSFSQKLTGTNNDIEVKLNNSDIITTSYDNTDYGSSANEAKLIFNQL